MEQKDREVTSNQILILIPVQQNHELNLVEHNSLTGTWTVICYNLIDSFLHRSSEGINVNKIILDATTRKIFYYNNKISLFVGKVNNHAWKLTLHSLVTEGQLSTFKPVLHCNLSLPESSFDSENWLAVSHKSGEIIIPTVLHDRINLNIFSTSGKKWLLAYSILAQPLTRSVKVKISSCIVVSNYLYCSMVQQEVGARICQFNIRILQQYQRNSINVRPVNILHIRDNPTLQNCFVSTHKEVVVIICCSNINDKSCIEVRQPKPRPTGISSVLYRYEFSKVNIVGASADPCSKNLVLAIIYRDIEDDKYYIKRIDMSQYSCTPTQ